MTKKILPPLFACFCVLSLVFLHAESTGPAVNISKIQVQPGALSTKLVLETEGQLSPPKAYYLPDAPQTLVASMESTAGGADCAKAALDSKTSIAIRTISASFPELPLAGLTRLIVLVLHTPSRSRFQGGQHASDVALIHAQHHSLLAAVAIHISQRHEVFSRLAQQEQRRDQDGGRVSPAHTLAVLQSVDLPVRYADLGLPANDCQGFGLQEV